jgi:hypothetical protein
VKHKFTATVIFSFIFVGLWAQEQDSIALSPSETKFVVEEVVKEEYDPLAPSRAAFYSAVVPGLGQFYNKKYWKIPLVYGGIAASLYFYIDNNNDYHRFRDAYKRRLAGYDDDEFQGITTETLIRAQTNARRNKDTSLAIAIGVYLVNIIDANVDAHLKQFNVSDDLTIRPNVDYNPMNASNNYSLSLTYSFN